MRRAGLGGGGGNGNGNSNSSGSGVLAKLNLGWNGAASRFRRQAVSRPADPSLLVCPHLSLFVASQAVFNLDLDYSDDDALLDWEQYAGGWLQRSSQRGLRAWVQYAGLGAVAGCAASRARRLLCCAARGRRDMPPSSGLPACRHEPRALLRPGLLGARAPPEGAAVVVRGCVSSPAARPADAAEAASGSRVAAAEAHHWVGLPALMTRHPLPVPSLSFPKVDLSKASAPLYTRRSSVHGDAAPLADCPGNRSGDPRRLPARRPRRRRRRQRQRRRGGGGAWHASHGRRGRALFLGRVPPAR